MQRSETYYEFILGGGGARQVWKIPPFSNSQNAPWKRWNITELGIGILKFSVIWF